MAGENGPAATFELADESIWRALIEQSSRGSELDSLAGRTDDGITIEPIYGTPEKRASSAGRALNTPWVVVQRMDDTDSERAEKSLAADLDGGANGIELIFAGSGSAQRTGFGMIGVDRGLIETLSTKDNLHLRIDAGEATYSYFESFSRLKTAELTLVYDQLAHAAARGGLDRPLAEIEREIVGAAEGLGKSARSGAAVVADGRVWAAGGASEAQELAGILGSLVHNARLLIGTGLPPEKALSAIGIIVECGSNQVLAIAKIRALRLAHARIVEEFGSPPMAARIHAETSWRMMTRYGVHTNILRIASATFAAGIGGADSITVLPYTIALGLPDNMARRIARNSQVLLTEEAGLARVSDPAAGSGAIETLTGAIAAAAWEELRVIEATGGLFAALRSGSFQRDIATMREARAGKIARRKIAITGISEFPNLEETKTEILEPRPTARTTMTANSETIERLVAGRLAEPFEALRDRSAMLVSAGTPPKVFLAILGATADLTEAAQTANDYFAAAGIGTVAASGLDTPEQVAEAFAKTGARTACIVGREETLRHAAASIASTLKDRGAVRVYVIGATKHSADIDAALDDEADAVKILHEVLEASI